LSHSVTLFALVIVEIRVCLLAGQPGPWASYFMMTCACHHAQLLVEMGIS
jgi:hypothetical protein